MTTVRGYQVLADWSGDGDYADTLEDVTNLVAGDVVITYGRDTAQSAAPTMSSAMAYDLDNETRAFSPENGASAITGLVLPGVPTTCIKDGVTLYGGVIADFDVDVDRAHRQFSAKCLDALGTEKLSTPVYSGMRTGAIIELILDEIGWTGGRAIDPGATNVAWWWANNETPAEAIEKLVDSEGPTAIAFVERGEFVFHDRHHRMFSATATTSQATFTLAIPAGSGPVGSMWMNKDPGYDHGLKHIFNTVTFDVGERRPGPVEQVWSTEDTYTLGANETIDVPVVASDAFIWAVVPEAGVDFTVTGTVEVALSRDSGQSTVISVRAAGAPATVTGLALRAAPLAVARTYRITAEDTASISKYRARRPWEREAPWCNRYDAQALADIIVTMFAENRPTVSFSISNLGATYLAEILARRIGDRVTIRNDELGLNDDFIVEKLEHTISKLGATDHTLTYWCSVVGATQPANVLTFDVAGSGFNDGVFALLGVDDPDRVLLFDAGSGHRFDEGVFAT